LLVATNCPMFDCLAPADIIAMHSADFWKLISTLFYIERVSFWSFYRFPDGRLLHPYLHHCFVEKPLIVNAVGPPGSQN
jgi:hypothetical protein